MPTLITVCAARPDHRVACSESHPDHPGGTAWVVGDGATHRVALTREVARRIWLGDLTVVDAASADEADALQRIGDAGMRGAEAGAALKTAMLASADPAPARKRGA